MLFSRIIRHRCILKPFSEEFGDKSLLDRIDSMFDTKHPFPERRIHALENGNYREVALRTIEKAKALFDRGDKFDSWQDYVTNRSQYDAIQNEIK